MKKLTRAALFTSAVLGASIMAPITHAADYIVDYKGAHASVNFKIKHLGYSWLAGRFDKFSGTFSYDAKNITASKIEMNVDVQSINSNHVERDKHLRSDDYLDVSSFNTAKFVSSSIEDKGNGAFIIHGDLTLHGVTKNIAVDAHTIGEGKDPWGGYRAGFTGTTRIGLTDFGINANLGPASTHVELTFHIEGIRQ